jgi:hypothetical protein
MLLLLNEGDCITEAPIHKVVVGREGVVGLADWAGYPFLVGADPFHQGQVTLLDAAPADRVAALSAGDGGPFNGNGIGREGDDLTTPAREFLVELRALARAAVIVVVVPVDIPSMFLFVTQSAILENE